MSARRTPWLLLLGLTAFLRLPYLWAPVQGDDAFYLAMAQHALVDPAHPNHFRLVAQGTEVDMRGFPKPPGNAWILAGLLRAVGDVREPAFHLFYAGLTLMALWAVWELALVFCVAPRWAVAVFAAVPAFVINGNSLEADIPFVAFFLLAMAFLVRGGTGGVAMVLSAWCGSAAAAIEYKAIALVPLMAWWVWRGAQRTSVAAWCAVFAPGIAIAAWQVFESATTGAASAQVLAGYFQTRGLQSVDNKLRNALALSVHAGWMVSPVLALGTFARLDWVIAGVAAALAGALIDASPLCWLPLGCGAALLVRAVRSAGEFLSFWTALYFCFSLAAFFAGSARYLLPAAAPLAMTIVNRLPGRTTLLAAGFSLQMALALALNQANLEHWNSYRRAVDQVASTLGAQRSWVAAEWGLRFYSESAGAAPLHRGQALRPGDVVISSRIGQPIAFTTGGGVAAPVFEAKVEPWLPMRLIAPASPSAYSTHSGGFRAFDITTAPADTITVSQIVERAPRLSFVPMNAGEAAFQMASGVYELQDSWRWTNRRVVALLKRPARAAAVEATFRIIDQSPVRHATLSVDGETVAEATYQGPGLYTLRSQGTIAAKGETVTAILTFDRTFHTPQDARELAAILTGIGFAPAP